MISEGNAQLIAYHNTLVGGGWGTIYLKNVPNSIVMNNIIINNKINGWGLRVEGTIVAHDHINFNIYFLPNSESIIELNNENKTWSEWQQLGFDSESLNQNPLLNDPANRNFKLQHDSPAIDSGMQLPFPYNFDKDGIKRPFGNGFDLGAYEFNEIKF